MKVNFGGGSLFWSGIIQEAREWELKYHWPDSVRRFLLREGGYDRATTLMRKQTTRGPYEEDLVKRLRSQLPDYQVEKLPRARHQPHLTELPDGGIVLQNVTRESNGMFSTVDLLLDTMSYPCASGKSNLTINLNHLVTTIETEGPRATAVVCQDLVANECRRYKGRVIVLAAGSLGSTRIALASGLSDPNGMIGRGLTDHPNFRVRYEWPIDESPISLDDHAKLVLRHAEAAHEHHPYNVEVLVNYQYWDRRVSDEDIWWQHIVRRMDKVGIDIQFFFPSALNDNNRVTLDSNARKLVVYTEPNHGGRQYSEEVREVSATVLETITAGQPPTWTSGHAYFDAAQIGHLGGTLRMGT